MMLSRLYRYGPEPNSHDWIKALAIILMIIDHLGVYLFPDQAWLRLLGRGSAPLFFFAVGYVNKHRFRADLLIFGLLLTALTFARTDQLYINILINFVIIKLVLDYFDPNNIPPKKLISVFVLLIAVHVLTMNYLEYGGFGLLFAIGASLLKTNHRRASIWLAATTLLYIANELLVFNWFNKPLMMGGLALIGLMFFSIFYFYQEKTISIKPLNTSMMFLGRYSLEIYFWHLVVFNLVYLMLNWV